MLRGPLPRCLPIRRLPVITLGMLGASPDCPLEDAGSLSQLCPWGCWGLLGAEPCRRNKTTGFKETERTLCRDENIWSTSQMAGCPGSPLPATASHLGGDRAPDVMAEGNMARCNYPSSLVLLFREVPFAGCRASHRGTRGLAVHLESLDPPQKQTKAPTVCLSPSLWPPRATCIEGSQTWLHVAEEAASGQLPHARGLAS